MSRTTVDAAPGSRPPPEDDTAFFGRPKGLLTLSGPEVREPFWFLGMQAILVLYSAHSVAHEGMGMAAGTAASVSAAHGTLVYLVSVAGGRLADRMLGSYRAGTGLLKPSAATMIGKLYRTDDERRDAGFALYCMAITIGAFAGPLITGRLGEHKGWHWGFSAAALGMAFGLVQYATGRRHLAGRRHAAEFALAPDDGGPPARAHASVGERRAVRLIVVGVVVTGGIATALVLAGRLTLDRFVDLLTLVSVIAPVGYLAVMFRSPRVTAEERGRLKPYIVLFLASTVFHFILFQAYGTLMLPASTNAETTILGFGFPAGWYASALGAFGVVLGGPSFLLTVPPTRGHGSDDCFGVNGAIAVVAGLVVMAAAPWLRRPMRPVH